MSLVLSFISVIIKRNILVFLIRANKPGKQYDLITANKYFCVKSLFCDRTYLKSCWEKHFEGLQTSQIVPHVTIRTLSPI